jgi:hypothetical protein
LHQERAADFHGQIGRDIELCQKEREASDYIDESFKGCSHAALVS